MKIIIALVLGLMLNDAAHAVDLFAFDKANDISLNILAQVFGGLLTEISGGVDGFAGAMQIFNGAVLAIGGVFVGYTILMGTINTAHDGEALGKKMNSAWVPIRIGVGTALIMPVISGGYCVMQVLVMWAITQGVGLANNVWGAYLQNSKAGDYAMNFVMSKNDQEKIRVLVKNLAISSSCVAIQSKYVKGSPEELNLAATQNWGITSDSNNNELLFGNTIAGTSIFSIKKNACGSVSFVTTKYEPPSTSITGGGFLEKISIKFKSPNVSRIYEAQKNATIKVSESLMSLSAQKTPDFVNGTGGVVTNPITNEEIDSHVEMYINLIKEVITSDKASLQPENVVKKSNESGGWIISGAWFMQNIISFQAWSTAATAIPKAEAKSIGTMQYSDETLPVANAMQINLMKRGEKEVVNAKNSIISENNKASDDSAAASWITKKIRFVLNLDELKTDTRHPILILQNLGSRMLNIWEGAFYAITAAAVAAAAVPWFGDGATPAIISVALFLFAPFAALLTLGFMLAYVLPNLPFILWLGVAVGWVVMCVEAIIAAPMWAAMHLHPDGSDAVGRGGAGYQLLLALTLKPVLAIFGLIAAIILSGVIGSFINSIFFEFLYMGETSYMPIRNVLAGIFAVGIYTYVMYETFKKLFDLVHVVPDQLLKWIGAGSGGELGNYSGSIGRGSAERGVAGATFAAGYMTKEAGQQMGQLGQQIGQKRIKDALDKQGQLKKDGDINIAHGADTIESRDAMISTAAAASGQSTYSQNPSMWNTVSNNKLKQPTEDFNNTFNSALGKVFEHNGGTSDPSRARQAVDKFKSSMEEKSKDGFKSFGDDDSNVYERAQKAVLKSVDEINMSAPEKEMPVEPPQKEKEDGK